MDSVDTFLRTGSFRTSRSRSPQPNRIYDRPAPEAQSYKSDARSSRPSGRSHHARPPPPSVEDEVQSLAREYSASITPSQSEDEPKNRGEIDQFPLMVEVFDENPERRFVIVTNSETGTDDDAGDAARSDQKLSPTKSEYDDNTCRQYVLVTPEEKAKESVKAPGLSKRKSHRDLPRLETEPQSPQDSTIRRSNSSRRNREKAVVDQPIRDSARPNDDVFLSPVVTHITGGRERAYLDLSKSPGGGRGHSRDNSRSMRNDDRGSTKTDDRRSTRNDDRDSTRSSTSPSLSRRRLSSTAAARSYINPMDGYGHGNADAIIAFMSPGGEQPPRKGSRDLNSPVMPYWQPGPLDPEKKKTPVDQQIITFKRCWEDTQQGALSRPPECRWRVPSVPGDVRFLSLPRAENFIICPDCYDAVFAKNEEFKRFFVDAPDRPPDKAVSCNYGSSPWYHIAFILTLKYQYQDLRLLETVASVAARQPPCPETQSASRVWHSILDPSTRRLVDRFDICPSCVGMVSSLLPTISGVFQPVESHNTLSRSACDFYYAPERRRFLEFFDLMENTHDKAISLRGGADFQALADRVRDMSLVEECPRNFPLRNAKWHVIEGLPEFTVCEECYDAVVWPMVEGNDNKRKNEVAESFIRRRQKVDFASCQLYSDRMREVFGRACRRNELGYLEAKVKEKFAMQAEIKSKLAVVLQQNQDDPNVQKERAELMRRLREIE
ncbi:hypothetical protein B0T16DRAFT_454269 [Cercophora newfieldiana]|uniref:Uncharacterized protein n=1 Tax=Cercophora newfieldiana TaxID=92897 RepID=A0AA39YI03_9PEZI|nr:hypothetical protein B0T16DRAFT_454269 [Cercophora newfieldiana]